ncbi:putative thiol:disulfide oxidoreductase, nitrite reductase complex assembly [Grimontia indica]|uniref:Thiol:disulfide oxidoreductase, nitrite reductase complex assembly n=2 Tax=Grimontia indica TaxID=1056512 RepID=R1IWK9_9GAMM|nr:putative thiol:disulfide oxidoreductase, nitrite reductase complex assembly [Grimontia indica]
MSLKSAGIPIVGLNYRDKKNAAISVLKETGDPYQTVIYDPQGSLALELGSIVTPETYLIDREGTLMFRHIGILDEGIWQREFQPRIDDITSKKEGS